MADQLNWPDDKALAKSLTKLLTNAAWAAGLFEGEGSFFAHKNRYKYYPNASVCMTDRDVLERFLKIVKVGRLTGPYHDKRGRRKPKYQWNAFNKDAIKVMEFFTPFMCNRRQEQILSTLDRCWRHNNGMDTK